MNSTGGLNAATMGLFLFLIVTQILAISLLPRTAGFTNFYWTALFAVVMGVSQYSFSYIIYKGIPISSLVPLMAAIIPLATIFVGVLIYREPASIARIVLLCLASGMVGVASAMR